MDEVQHRRSDAGSGDGDHVTRVNTASSPDQEDLSAVSKAQGIYADFRTNPTNNKTTFCRTFKVEMAMLARRRPLTRARARSTSLRRIVVQIAFSLGIYLAMELPPLVQQTEAG